MANDGVEGPQTLLGRSLLHPPDWFGASSSRVLIGRLDHLLGRLPLLLLGRVININIASSLHPGSLFLGGRILAVDDRISLDVLHGGCLPKNLPLRFDLGLWLLDDLLGGLPLLLLGKLVDSDLACPFHPGLFGLGLIQVHRCSVMTSIDPLRC